MILKIGVLSKTMDWRLPLYKSVKLWLRTRTKRRRKRVRNVSQTEEGLWRSMKEVNRYQEGPDAQWRKKAEHSRICTVPWQGRGSQIHRQSVIQVRLGIPGLRTSPQSLQFTNTLQGLVRSWLIQQVGQQQKEIPHCQANGTGSAVAQTPSSEKDLEYENREHQQVRSLASPLFGLPQFVLEWGKTQRDSCKE